VGVFRGWKNIFLGIALVCLLLSQAAFWAINLGVVKTPVASETAAGPQNGGVQIVGGMNAQAARDANEAGAKSGIAGDLFTKLDFEHTARAVELINGILIIAAVLYAASVFFSLMVSLVGRLGGISHISRAFILALIALVLIIPWQMLGLSVLGVIWTAEELIQWLPTKDANVWNTAIFYLRFTGYWLAVVLLLLLSHARGTQWSKSIIRRLEII
jgi:hypothetical protein